jgi:CRP/FNR family transcriptional regulator, cyclic AMP receptor protein
MSQRRLSAFVIVQSVSESDKSSSAYQSRIDKLFSTGHPKTYPKNQLIHYEGDPLSHVYLIKKGYVKAYTILDSGDTRTMMILGAEDIFPLAFSESMSWQSYRIRYFYQSLTDTELQVLPSDMLKQKIESGIEMMEAYMTYLAASNQIIMNQLEVMKNKKAIDKVGMLLPYLISKAGRQVKPGVFRLELKLSHQEIADLSGVTRETTTTLIKQLEKEGIIDQSDSRWIIDENKLDKIAGHR